jgi:hypothetical protein
MVRGVHWHSRMVSGVSKVIIAFPSLEWDGEGSSLAEYYGMVSGVPKVLPFSQPSLEWDSEGSLLAE